MKNGIGWAVKQMQDGKFVTRAAWNGNKLPPDGKVRLWCYLVNPLEPSHRDYVMMRTVDGEQVPWLCSQSDLLADDWFSIRLPSVMLPIGERAPSTAEDAGV